MINLDLRIIDGQVINPEQLRDNAEGPIDVEVGEGKWPVRCSCGCGHEFNKDHIAIYASGGLYRPGGSPKPGEQCRTIILHPFNLIGNSIINCEIRYIHVDPDYGHLGNENYSFYFDRGRRDLQNEFGLCPGVLKKDNIGIWVRRSSIEHLSQVLPGSKVQIHSSFEAYKDDFTIRMRQRMVQGRVVHAKCRSDLLFVRLEQDNGHYTPLRVLPPLEEFVEKLSA